MTAIPRHKVGLAAVLATALAGPAAADSFLTASAHQDSGTAVRIDQTGNSNTARTGQRGDRVGLTVQQQTQGAPVTASDPVAALIAESGLAVVRRGNRAVAQQDGTGLTARIDQRGQGNVARLTQTGFTHNAALRQHGRGNAALVAQRNRDNTARIAQQGAFNSAAVRQTGTASRAAIVQTGRGNSATALQKGDRQVSRIEQKGSGNSAAVAQTRNGSEVTVKQFGDDLRLALPAVAPQMVVRQYE